MERFIGRFAPYAFALLRIVSGLLFATHGTQKLFGWPGNKPPMDLPPLMHAAGWIELVAGVLIAIGLLAGFAAFIASGEMAVAYFMAHFPKDFWPTANQGEAAVLFCFIFLFIACHGAGVWSIDGLRRGATSSGSAVRA
jgi:putative oxidoreductase